MLANQSLIKKVTRKWQVCRAEKRQNLWSLQAGGKKMTQEEMPVGFAMAPAMNSDAMQRFVTLTEEQKQRIIEGTHNIKNREEMHRYVVSLVSDKQ